MKEYRKEYGFIDLDSIPIDCQEENLYTFVNHGKKYYFKYVKNVTRCYHELLAEELAHDYGIPCARYDIASLDGNIGYISEDIFQEQDHVYSLTDILKNVPLENQYDFCKTNNFKDIQMAFTMQYHDIQVEKELMQELTNIFFFDVLIANIDRHSDNLFIVENASGIHFSKLLDNEFMLNDICIQYGGYSIGIDREDYFYVYYQMMDKMNFLEKYLLSCSESDRELFESKIWIISKENIESVLTRIEKKINAPINPEIREKIGREFQENREMIERVLKNTKNHKNKKKKWPFYIIDRSSL